MRIGVFSLQGAVQPHLARLRGLGVDALPVRTADELNVCDGLILPGGESTTLLKLIGEYQLKPALMDYAREHAVWGICAGSILMASHVENPSQESLGLMPCTIRRNAYGRQNESFIGEVRLFLPEPAPDQQEAVFIRAPIFQKLDEGVTILARHKDTPVAIQYNRYLATTFHPELSESETFHRFFLTLCNGNHT